MIFPYMCKDENNIVITQMNQILSRWKEYFCTILKSDMEDSLSYHRVQSSTPDNQTDTEILSPSYNEVCSIINKLKSNKAEGTDNINPELIKHGGKTFKQRIHNLKIMIWEKEQLPSQWNEGIICPLYKKGDRLDCTNYRPITLLNVAYKIFSIILNQRLVNIMEAELSNHQSGFRTSRSTIDNIFMIRQIIEKCYKYNIDIHNIFIDYTHAFDSTKREQNIRLFNPE
jgi:sorting nexin-29